MELEEAKERLKRFDGKCDKCPFSACEQCEINYSDVQAINMVLEELYRKNRLEKLCSQYRFKNVLSEEE